MPPRHLLHAQRSPKSLPSRCELVLGRTPDSGSSGPPAAGRLDGGGELGLGFVSVETGFGSPASPAEAAGGCPSQRRGRAGVGRRRRPAGPLLGHLLRPEDAEDHEEDDHTCRRAKAGHRSAAAGPGMGRTSPARWRRGVLVDRPEVASRGPFFRRARHHRHLSTRLGDGSARSASPRGAARLSRIRFDAQGVRAVRPEVKRRQGSGARVEAPPVLPRVPPLTSGTAMKRVE